ncbi:MAG TPA: type VII secretion integral membrane protein EccD [Pseudonocardiaceae bacterium]|nr:type VII secretion integral membrane protein EccD [Pseudonocardiaceae bacterium]
MATGTTVFSRVTVVAPRTRIDVALPADVSIADLLPMLLDMAKEATPDGGARHGGWCLARLGEAPLDPGRTLASLGVVDGDLLQLRKRSDNPPPPLYDDVVDAIAESTPESYRPWTTETAHRFGHVAAGLALITAAVAALMAGPIAGPDGEKYRILAAIAAGVIAVVSVAVGASVVHAYQARATGVVIAATGGLPMAFVCGLYLVPVDKGAVTAANYLLGAALVAVVAGACILILGAGVTVFIAAAAVGVLGLLAFLVATLVSGATTVAVAAGTSAVALAALSILPRLTIQLAKLPLPNVPRDAEDLREDSGFPDYRVIEQRTARAHEYMTGMIVGCGLTAAIAAVLAAGTGDVSGPLLAAAVSLVLLLRGRTYANGSQAVALMITGIIAGAGLLIGWLIGSSQANRLVFVFGVLVLVGAATLVVGIVFPERRFSPVLRRAVDVLEAVLIAAVLPLALWVMNLYSVVRHMNINL